MHTRSQSRNLHNQQHQAPPPVVEPFNLEEPFENPPPPPPPMDDQRTMAQLLEAPTAGYEDAIVVPEIAADNFELKHGLLNLVQNKQFFGHDKEDPHAHIRYFNKITSTMKFPNVPSTSQIQKFVIHVTNPVVCQRTCASTSTPGISSEVAELKDMVKALLLDKKNQSPAPTPVKAWRNDCSYCGGTIRFVTNQNRGISNQLLLTTPGSARSSFSTLVLVQPPAYQAPAYQAPVPQTQGVSKTDFDSYVKANDAVMRNMQNQNQVLQTQGQNLQTQLNNLATSNQKLEKLLVTLSR
ncbi:hypothetical protein Tco_1311169 [Tanacetum coccineum]